MVYAKDRNLVELENFDLMIRDSCNLNY